MLADISIENLGVIEHATAELSSGLTVLTGETGAGKTMVVTGLRLLAGGRSDASRVRQGSDRAVVEGRFSLEGSAVEDEVAQLVEDACGKPDENGEYIALRQVSASGRSKAYLGGRAVPAATLADFAAKVLTIHGQNDQLRLLAPDQQLAAVDRSDDSVAPLVHAYQESFSYWRSLSKDYKLRTQSRRELAQEVDRLNFAVTEISEVEPLPGEDVALVEEISRLQDVDGLREAASVALEAIDGSDSFEDDSASALVGKAHSHLASAENKQLLALGAQLAEITARLGDIAGELGQFLADLPADASALEASLQRQQDLKNLTRKYAPDIDGVLAFRDKALARLETLDTSSEAMEELKKKVIAAEKDMIAKAAQLSRARKAAAKALSVAVTAELAGLAMGASEFSAVVRETKYSRTGADEVELMLNGRALASSASGGELSRVMLALEVVLAANTSGTTMVFDEVDAGVGGRAAVEIGRRLARLAQKNQVIVVTHLPQVAAFATAHLHVAKELSTSGVSRLSDAQRVEELARMMAGLDGTETGRAHAQELFDKAQSEVQALARA